MRDEELLRELQQIHGSLMRAHDASLRGPFRRTLTPTFLKELECALVEARMLASGETNTPKTYLWQTLWRRRSDARI